MPESDVADTRPTSRKRPSQSRVVPAIPLALGKPKSLPKAGRPARAEATSTTPTTPAHNTANDGVSVSVSEAISFPTTSSEGPSTTGEVELSLQNGVGRSTTATPESRDTDSMPPSNGVASEPRAAESQIVSTPPPPSGQPALLSPPSKRRSTGKSDMRPLRTQMPPDFVPSVERETPHPIVSPLKSSPQHSFPNHVHRPSVNGVVFGSHGSTTSSTVPPQSADSTLSAAQWPPLGASRPVQSTTPGHAHRNSEPVNQRVHNPSSVPWHMRQSFQLPAHPPPQFHHAYTPFRYPPREVFTPAEENPRNGFHRSRSQSLSQGSGIAARNGDLLQSPAGHEDDISTRHTPREAFAPFQPLPPQLRHHYKQPPPPLQQVPQGPSSRSDDSEALRYHVRSQFGDSTFADCVLQIVEHGSGAEQSLDAHRIILSRSPTLLDIIRRTDMSDSTTLKQNVHVSLRGHGVTTEAFVDCMRYLYGGSLAALELLRHAPLGSAAFSSNGERMQTALQLVATAAWLRLPAVAGRAMGAALSMLHWDTMAPILGFALDGGLGLAFVVDEGADMSCASSDDSLGRADGLGTPTYDPYSTDLLHRLIDFTVHMFPPNFYLDAAAPQLAECPRLPPLPPAHESRPSRSDPRLSQIRFGELSVEDHGRPSQVTTMVSSMLLSLPFPLLKGILEHNAMVYQLGADTVASIQRQVVAEREIRRKRILQARTAGRTDDGAGLQLIQNLYSEERVEPSPNHRSGSRLARSKKGIDTPPSSGAASEGSKQELSED
ncbi:hypothetical protein LTR49_015487 [Elasticomyces elasticus]|nr:hypothetical protein LTR49_015487 [Elasticomyces elasticus]